MTFPPLNPAAVSHFFAALAALRARTGVGEIPARDIRDVIEQIEKLSIPTAVRYLTMRYVR